MLTHFGIALGGGGARGLAHIGVMQVLERENLRPTVFAGTSIGGLLAAFFAAGKTGIELEEIALAADMSLSTVKRRLKEAQRRFQNRGKHFPTLASWMTEDP